MLLEFEEFILSGIRSKISDIRFYACAFVDIPNLPVPDVQNNLEKEDAADEQIPYEAVEALPPYQQLPLHARYYYDRPGMKNILPIRFAFLKSEIIKGYCYNQTNTCEQGFFEIWVLVL